MIFGCLLSVMALAGWRGETVNFRPAADVVIGTPPAGVTVREGVLRDVRYVTKPHGTEYASVADRVEWGVRDAKSPRIAQVVIAADAKPGQYAFGDVELTVVDRLLPSPREWKYFMGGMWHNPWSIARLTKTEPWSEAHLAECRKFLGMTAAIGSKVIMATLSDLPWNHQCYDANRTMIRHIKHEGTGEWTFDYTVFDKWVSLSLETGNGPKISCYSLIPWGYEVYWEDETGHPNRLVAKPGTKEFAEYWGPFLRDFEKHLKEKGWMEQTVLAFDERSPEDVKAILDFLAKEKISLLTSAACNEKSDAFRDVRVAMHSQILNESMDDAFFEMAKKRYAEGRGATVYYVCCFPEKPNTFMWSDPDDAFWLAVMPIAKGIQGMSRWTFDSWPKDPMKDASYYWWNAGDTFFAYPDGSPSIRYLMLQNGVQNGEKWRILREAGVRVAELEALAKRYDIPTALKKNDGDFSELISDTLKVLNAVTGPAVVAKPAKPYWDTTSWDPPVAKITDTDKYLRRKFRQDVTDRSTGLNEAELRKLLNEIVAAGKASNESWRITKAKCFAAQATRMAIDVSSYDWFPAISVWNRWSRPISGVYWTRAAEVNAKMMPPAVRAEWQKGNASGDWKMWQDFDHSVPDWRVILKLGFPGMKERLVRIAHERKVEKVGEGGQWTFSDPFYEGLRISIDAVLAGIDRFIAQGEKNRGAPRTSPPTGDSRTAVGSDLRADRLEKEIACLKRLRSGPPQTAYDMMMFVWLYFMYSEHLDGIQCRSLTEIDVFITPYYEADIAAGRTTETEFREQFKHWLWQWGSINNYWNQPVGLGGTKKDGSSEYNHVSKIILEVMDECNLPTPKFLAKIAENTPDWALDKMLDLARRHRSICFISEESCARALKLRPGVTDEDCRTMAVGGCYEFGLRDARNGSGAGHVNMLKPVERMLTEASVCGAPRTSPPTVCATNVAGASRTSVCATAVGADVPGRPLASWDDFKTEYLRRLADVTTRCRKVAEETEKVLPEVNPANMMSLATEHSLKTRKDGYANGCPRGNGTGILAVGPGTTVDALLAIKELVYEKHECTLAELGKIMAEDWKGHEDLRLRMLRSPRKWGNNDPEANALGGEILKTFAAQLNRRPNARGGRFAASGHSARQYIELGERTGATPDGRKAGEEMSKNLSPTMGADTEGATALVMTLANSGTTVEDLPSDYPLDVMLHPSACSGEKGLQAMKAIVRRFHKNGGSVVQFTVFSAEELRDAQAHPEKYENLQVRICGWNVRWNDLSRVEQDAFIRRADAIQH